MLAKTEPSISESEKSDAPVAVAEPETPRNASKFAVGELPSRPVEKAAKRQPFTHALVNLAKKVYDANPALVKKLGLMELCTVPPYRPLYMKRIDKKMEEFNS